MIKADSLLADTKYVCNFPDRQLRQVVVQFMCFCQENLSPENFFVKNEKTLDLIVSISCKIGLVKIPVSKKKRIRTVSVSAVPLLQGLAKLCSPWCAMVWVV